MPSIFEKYNQFEPYIIAEIGVNHEGDIELAKRLIREAKEGGAHAAKFQTYKANKIAAKNSPAYWDTNKEPTKSQFELFKKLDSFGDKEYKELARYCEEIEIDFLSTPFDLDAVDSLNPLMKLFKIASADLTNIPLLRKCASMNKPIILSTGASTFPEIEYAISELQKHGAKDISILHCVLNYPTPVENADLNRIKKLKKLFPTLNIGYSDHVAPDETISALEMACLYGSVILEKHFTHDKSLPGNDHYHAMDKEDLKVFKARLKRFKHLDGTFSEIDFLENQSAARLHARRSIVSLGNIKKGEILSEKNLIAKRPAHGISPILWDDILGSTALCNIEDDTIINWNMFSQK